MMQRNVLDGLDYSATKAYLAWHENDEVRSFASSGGVARGLIVEMLQARVVDAAYSLYDDCHGRPDLEGKWLTGEINHRAIPSSIYRPVFWGKNIAGVDPTWKSVLVVGLPCQIKGAKTFFDKHHPHLQVVTLVIFCKKQKSQAMTRTYLRHSKAGVSRMKDFRYRGEGYPGCFRIQHEDKWMAPFVYPLKAWYPHACRFCLDPLLVGEADVVLADPWQLIDREKEQLGKNLLIVQSPKGVDVVASAKSLMLEEICNLKDAYFTSLTLDSYRAKEAQARQLANHVYSPSYLWERSVARLGEWFFWFFGTASPLANRIMKFRKR